MEQGSDTAAWVVAIPCDLFPQVRLEGYAVLE